MQLLFAYLLDLLVGDPRQLPHPVIFIGRLISALEKRLQKPHHSPQIQLVYGTVVVVLVLATTAGAVLFMVWAASLIHPVAGVAVSVVLLSTTLAVRSLSEAAQDVIKPLASGDLPGARYAVSMIVGRDSALMDEHEVARATVETVAENTVDGVTAPLFYALVGGLPLAMAYKAVNTMDSMLGYKNDRYLYFGRAAAKLDDAANWLPARITVVAMLVASRLLSLNTGNAWQAVKADGQKHPSPNSGLAEALTAGALDITLGGENRYGGQVSRRPQLWAAGQKAGVGDIKSAARLMQVTSLVFIMVGLLIRSALNAII
ncbi:adenosylcobinamide-phosphate synthase CbiB [Dethiobacter alkaliphilus]|uniref:adenosylcobinamide-phosphate synthase CbiB n=1 Tax=Dethiobacter alkaliphilus TaxID=427926 RepID=UPI002226F13E|nr:adenosylcobinamide-phosphate synthase CbiB [Dethiobacter alkaliphilus]MCW3491487.1 adenosylcobinamide-phosphate synthase CbiB [Dethiobacter alkaliphilus]